MKPAYAELLRVLAQTLRANVTGPGSQPHRDAIDAALRAVARAEIARAEMEK
jgi:hypothetical protein